MAALAEALCGDFSEPEDLFHHPDRPNLNQLLRDQPHEIVDLAMKLIAAIRVGGDETPPPRAGWLTNFFDGRSADEIERMKTMLEAAFPPMSKGE
jgi:hypothetical protein